MTNAEFIEKRCDEGINGAYVLIKDEYEDIQDASKTRGFYVFDGDWGRGYGWYNFKHSPFIECLELPYYSNGVQVFGLLIK